MAFEMHTDIGEHPTVTRAGLGGLGLFVLCGSWTAANGETGVVPVGVARRHGSTESIAALVDAGLWTEIDGGYRMEFGPGTDWPLPLWRYSEASGRGALLSVVPDPEG